VEVLDHLLEHDGAVGSVSDPEILVILQAATLWEGGGCAVRSSVDNAHAVRSQPPDGSEGIWEERSVARDTACVIIGREDDERQERRKKWHT
jgi:hypothetical protein